MAKIEWNKVTWYSKLLALLLFVALPFIFFYYGIQYGRLEEAAPAQISSLSTATGSTIQSDTLLSYYSDTAEWQTDANNTSGGFSISYPLDFDTTDNYSPAPSTDWRVGGNGAPGIKYFTLTVPRDFEPQTNFAGATLVVGASANNQAIAACMTSDPTGDPAIATSSATVNGIQFTVFHSSDVGAGNIYDTTSYRTLHDGKCYAVEYTIHSSQLANYPSSYGLQQFDRAKIDTLMENIVDTVTFM